MESFTRRVTENNMRGDTHDRTPRRVMAGGLAPTAVASYCMYLELAGLLWAEEVCLDIYYRSTQFLSVTEYDCSAYISSHGG